METRESEQGRSGDRRHDRRGLPRVRAGALAEDCHSDQRRKLSPGASAPGVHSEARRDRTPAGNPDGAGSRDPASRRTSAGAAFRGGLQRTQPWIPSRSLRPHGGG